MLHLFSTEATQAVLTERLLCRRQHGVWSMYVSDVQSHMLAFFSRLYTRHCICVSLVSTVHVLV